MRLDLLHLSCWFWLAVLAGEVLYWYVPFCKTMPSQRGIRLSARECCMLLWLGLPPLVFFVRISVDIRWLRKCAHAHVFAQTHVHQLPVIEDTSCRLCRSMSRGPSRRATLAESGFLIWWCLLNITNLIFKGKIHVSKRVAPFVEDLWLLEMFSGEAELTSSFRRGSQPF